VRPHGGQDRIVPSTHGEWLARHIRSAELWQRPDDGHISVLSSCPVTMRGGFVSAPSEGQP
jgi:pimeloyl-ACP methyl ester carboxylesterase